MSGAGEGLGERPGPAYMVVATGVGVVIETSHANRRAKGTFLYPLPSPPT
jgi:hypothetical protein